MNKKKEKEAISTSIMHCHTFGIEHPTHMCTICHFYKKQLCAAHDWYKKDGVWHWEAGFRKEFWEEYKEWRRKTGNYRMFFGDD